MYFLIILSALFERQTKKNMVKKNSTIHSIFLPTPAFFLFLFSLLCFQNLFNFFSSFLISPEIFQIVLFFFFST